MPRLFVAIDFPETVRLRLASLCCGIRGAKWLPAKQFHLTLRFIGESDDRLLDDIADGLAEIEFGAFDMRLMGVGHFPPRGAPKVLWAGVADGATPGRLHDEIEARLRRLGIAPDARKFAPHVTLARLKDVHLAQARDFLADHADFATESFPVSAFHLYASKLGHRGAVHTIEASYTLDDPTIPGGGAD